MKSLPSRSRPRARSRVLVRALVRVSGCLVLACGLTLGAADASSAGAPHIRFVPVPLGPDDRGGAQLDGLVTPVDARVPRNENGDFTLTVVNTGSFTADGVRLLLDDERDGNGVGSPDGRCLSRLDASSPADLWCELGAVEPGRSVTVVVHAFMSRCVGFDPDTSAPRQHAAAFRWRVGYTDSGRYQTVNGPTPRWSCGNLRHWADLDTDPTARRP
jgi:hypothetical protein